MVNIGAPAHNTFSQFCARYAKVDVYSSAGESGITAATLGKILSHDVVIAAVYDDNAACRAALSKLAGATNLIEVFLTGHYIA